MKKRSFLRNFTLILILILSFFLRIYKFEVVPPGIDWDEAATGYNAWSILETGRDEHGQFLPLSFKSFGDYKAPVFIYLLVPFIKVFGQTTFALRFPSALLGTLTVLLTYFLTKELFKGAKKFSIFNFQFVRLQRRNLRLCRTFSICEIAAFLLAISPWHLQFSRTAFEPNIALFLVVLGAFCLLRGIRENSALVLSLGSFSLALSLLTYHSSKIFTPLLFLILLFLYKKYFLQEKKKLILIFMIFGFVSLLTFSSFFKGGGSRFQAAGIFGKFSTIEKIGQLREEDKHKPFWLVRMLHNRPVFLTNTILRNYFSHFSPDFLFFGKETNWRVSLPFQGQLYLWEAPFFLLGIYYLFLNLKERSSRLLLVWFLLSPIPASIGQLTPHALRMLLSLPVPQIITTLGLLVFLKIIKRQKFGKQIIVYSLLIFVFLFFTSRYFYNYYLHFPYESGFDWQEGHKEMVEFVRKQEEGVEKIIVTDEYMQPYIFFLWFGKIRPQDYQEQGLRKYEFRAIDWPSDSKKENILLVGTKEEIPGDKIIKEIRFSNGQIAFRIVKT